MGASTRVFCGNLPFDGVDEGELRNLFRRCGKVASIKVITDHVTGRGKGFGFVQYSTAEDAARAILELDGEVVGGRAIRLNVATSQRHEDRGGLRGGYSGDRGGWE